MPPAGLFAVWLLVFYTAWTGIVVSAGLWPVVRAHWPISVAMAGGSFVGGSSPVAGGTVGFPVLVYVFDHPARLGRNFSLAIQSIGMVSASIYILTRGRKVEWRILRFALLGAAVAMPLGMSCIAPNVADVWVKILFSVVYASFGLLHLVRLGDIVANRRAFADAVRGGPGHRVRRRRAGRTSGLGHRGGGRHPALRHPGPALPHRCQGRDPDGRHPDGVHVAGRRGMFGDWRRSGRPPAGPRSSRCSRTGWPRHRSSPSAVRWAAWSRGSSRAGSSWVSWPFSAWLQYGWTCYHEHIVGWSLVAGGARRARGEPGAALALRLRPAIAAAQGLIGLEDAARETRMMSMRRTVTPGLARLGGGDQPAPRRDEPGTCSTARRAGARGAGRRSASASSRSPAT